MRTVHKYIFTIIILLIKSNIIAVEAPSIALVLSGGSAKGLAHIGVLKAFDEHGIEVDYIFGTSMGAIIGGMYASGLSALEIERIITNLDWNELLDDRVPRAELYTGQKRWLPTGNYYLSLANNFKPVFPQGLITGNKIHLQHFYNTWHVAHITDFSKFPIPFKCIATNLETGEIVIIDSGVLSDAMRASSSIPTIFVPFLLDDMLIIDGGITQNFPVDIAHQLGSDIIIGSKTNTEMLSREELNSAIRIMNQTINIGMQFRQHLAEPSADIIITPATDSFSLMDFGSAEEIVTSGYLETISHIDTLLSLKNDSRNPKTPIDGLPDYIKFESIVVNGNLYQSAPSIIYYLELEIDTYYNKDDIYAAFQRAYSTELFDQIYPNIIKQNNSYHLLVNVKEKERRNLGINLIYNEHDNLVLGLVLSMRNIFLNNSNLILNVQVGGKNNLDIDYTKIFSRKPFLYYRLFPYIKEEKLYIYDNDFQRIKSYNHMESGFTAGVGSHINRNIIFEPYLYAYRLEFRKNIAEEELFDRIFYTSGLGAKLYYETLNDYPFYTEGTRLFAKYNISGTNDVSERGYQKLTASMQYAKPIVDNMSLLVDFEYGSFLTSTPVPQDPFYIGGMKSFLGLRQNEISAPYYNKFNLGLRLNPMSNLYLDFLTNFVTYGNVEKFPIMDDSMFGLGAIVGYNTRFGPARLGVGMNENARVNMYISVGYDYDAFFFSRH